MQKRWICLYVENETGVLAKIAGLFAGKLYNLNSISVGETEDKTISRMTLGLTSDDKTFEQIKKQLNRCIEVIKVVDYTNIPIYIKELLYIKVKNCTSEEKAELFRIAEIFQLHIVYGSKSTYLIESLKKEEENNCILDVLKECFGSRIEIVRGGSVGIDFE